MPTTGNRDIPVLIVHIALVGSKGSMIVIEGCDMERWVK